MPKVNSKIWIEHYKVFMGMTDVLKAMQNPLVYQTWKMRFLAYETNEAAAKYVACHDPDYTEACRTFIELIKIYGKEGIK